MTAEATSHKSPMEALITTLITGGPPRFLITGSWTLQSGLDVSYKSMFERRKNLSGITITDTVLPWPPITIVEKDAQGELYQTGTKCDNCRNFNFILNVLIIHSPTNPDDGFGEL